MIACNVAVPANCAVARGCSFRLGEKNQKPPGGHNGGVAPGPRCTFLFSLRRAFADVYRAQNHVTDDRVTINGVSRPLSEIINEVTPEQLAPYDEIARDLRTARAVIIEPTYVIADGDALAVDLDAIERVNTFEMTDDATAYYNALGQLAASFDAFAQSVQMRSAPSVAGLRRTDIGWRVDTEWILFNLPHAAKGE